MKDEQEVQRCPVCNLEVRIDAGCWGKHVRPAGNDATYATCPNSEQPVSAPDPIWCDDCAPIKHWMSAPPYVNVRVCPKHASVDAPWRLLARIIDDLPLNRDWLDPEVESEARLLLDTLTLGGKYDG